MSRGGRMIIEATGSRPSFLDQNNRRVPASIRTNNPGAMYPGPASRKHGSIGFVWLHSKDGKHKCACFPDAVAGAAAMFTLLGSDFYTGRTIKNAIETWCGGFYLSTYLKVLEKETGTKPEDLLTREMVEDPAKAIPIAKAMALQEAGREYPLEEEHWRQAHAEAFPPEAADETWDPIIVPELQPTNSELAAVSRKVNGLLKLRMWIGAAVPVFGSVTLADIVGVGGEHIKFYADLLKQHSAIVLLFTLVVVLGFVHWVLWLCRDDLARGDWTPSGVAKGESEAS